MMKNDLEHLVIIDPRKNRSDFNGIIPVNEVTIKPKYRKMYGFMARTTVETNRSKQNG